jgi:arsenite methyltransferase
LMNEELKEKVRRRYAEAALAVQDVGEASCCGSSCCSTEPGALEVDLAGGSYSVEELDELPESATAASLGCGNPVALAALSPGEVVLDLGSGGGIDVLLSARRVFPGGKAYGLDMTGEMLNLARENRCKAGVGNAEFLKGEVEDVPLPDGHVDVVISNCVINLSTDKSKALVEAFRVLKPGGRFAVSDTVLLGDKGALPAGAEMWSGCVSGALEKYEYEELLAAAGFEDASVEVNHVHPPEVIAGLGGTEKVETFRRAPVASAFIRARKPVE